MPPAPTLSAKNATTARKTATNGRENVCPYSSNGHRVEQDHGGRRTPAADLRGKNVHTAAPHTRQKLLAQTVARRHDAERSWLRCSHNTRDAETVLRSQHPLAATASRRTSQPRRLEKRPRQPAQCGPRASIQSTDRPRAQHAHTNRSKSPCGQHDRAPRVIALCGCLRRWLGRGTTKTGSR